MTDKNQRDLTELIKAFDEVQMPRPPYVLENLVVNAKFTDEQKYAQCVLELSIAYDNLRLADLHMEQKQIEIDEITTPGRKGEVEREIKRIELEQTRRATLGAMREFDALYELWVKFPKKYTREDLNKAQEKEYTIRLEVQAQQDLNATGRITQGNQEGLRQIGKMTYPELDLTRSVENRFLESSKFNVLIAVATEEKAEKGLPCLTGLNIPNGASTKYYNSWGRKTDDSYNHIVETALNDKADYIITVEDDTFPPHDALVKLMDLIRRNPKTAVGAWYPKKEKSLQGAHIVLKDGERQQLQVDDKVHEVYTLCMGCTIFPIEMFMEIPYPWFKTTANLSQDSFFSQLAREHGWKLLVDTSIRCKHVDRNTHEIFMYDNDYPSLYDMQVLEEVTEMLDLVVGKKMILEIGTSMGGTLCHMMKVASDDAEFVSIDLPGGEFGGEFGQPSPEIMKKWLKGNQKLHTIRADSKSFFAVEQVKQILNGRKFDFVFIDGDHTYDGVKGDFEIYKQFADDVIAFHDIVDNNDKRVNVKKLWDELEGNKIEIVKDVKQGWGGIGILMV